MQEEQDQSEYRVDYSLDEGSFRKKVDELICLAQSENRVIPLPLSVDSMQAGIAVITSIVSQVKCDGCKVNCCRSLPGQIYLLPLEQERLGTDGSLPSPCPFLKNDRCSVYAERPLTCIRYPYQPGAVNKEGLPIIALASECPEACRIARDVYVEYWQIRKKYNTVGEEEFMENFFGVKR